MQKKICVIGGGRWGENHIRTLFKMGNLAGIVENNAEKLDELLDKYPVQGFSQVETALQQRYDGYVLATPAETHYPLGKTLLEKGLNTLIEKPLALSPEHSGELLEIADKTGARLMVGHLLLFHPAIRKIKEVIDRGKVGRLHYLYSNRLKMGTVRTEENVFWSFAPHDIAILDYLIGQPAIKIEAKGARFLQDRIHDFTMVQFEYPNNIHAHIFVSWLHPFKEQRLVVIGSAGMLFFDDSSPEKNILYYHNCIDWQGEKPVALEQPAEIIAYERRAPLEEELKYFINNLGNKFEISGGEAGHAVVQVLEKVQEQIEPHI